MNSIVERLAVPPSEVHTDCYCLAAQRAARRLARLYDDALRPYRLSHGQFSLLMLVAGMQPISVGQVAAELVMDRTTVTAIVKPLQRRGLLRTVAARLDARQRLFELTPAGGALLIGAAAAWRKAQALVAADRPRAGLRADLRRIAAVAPFSESVPCE